VTDGFNGWLFPDGNADALAAKIRQAIADRQALSQVGREGRRTAEEKADWKKNFAKLLEAYQRTGESHA
jgi:glycosyltransferase involved in cell wall biosynthesis